MNYELWIVIVIILVRNMMICICSEVYWAAMSSHKNWGNNERIHRDEHLKGIKSVTENEHLWIMKFIVVVLMYYHNVSENMEWMNSKNLTKWTCVVRSELAFAAVNCVVCSESVFTVESVLSTVNQHSLPKLCCLQWISVRCRKCVVCSKSAFATDIVLSATNSCSLLKVHCLQRINVRC
jgi:hypothetical protein